MFAKRIRKVTDGPTDMLNLGALLHGKHDTPRSQVADFSFVKNFIIVRSKKKHSTRSLPPASKIELKYQNLWRVCRSLSLLYINNAL